MDNRLNRRNFIGSMGAAGLAMVMNRRVGSEPRQTEKVRLGVIGVGSRGTHLLRLALTDSGVEVPAICDIKPRPLQRY